MKRGMSGILITSLILIGVVSVIAIGLTAIILSQKVKEQKAENQISITYYLRASNSKGTLINANYKILDDGKLTTGNLISDSYNFIGNTSSQSIMVLCYADGYYSELINKTFSQTEKSLNTSKITCSLDNIGTISIHNTGQLQINGDTGININIKSQGIYKELRFCLGHTAGITKVKVENSSINQTDIPDYYSQDTDACYDTNITLDNSEINIPFTVTTNQLNILDKLNFYFFDSDYAYNGTNFTFAPQLNGKNLGSSNDVEYTISNPNIE